MFSFPFPFISSQRLPIRWISFVFEIYFLCFAPKKISLPPSFKKQEHEFRVYTCGLQITHSHTRVEQRWEEYLLSATKRYRKVITTFPHHSVYEFPCWILGFRAEKGWNFHFPVYKFSGKFHIWVEGGSLFLSGSLFMGKNWIFYVRT